MSQTLERSVEFTRRQRRADLEDLQVAEAVEGDTSGKTLSAVAGRVIALYEGLEALDQHFRRVAGNARPNAEAAPRADMIAGEFQGYAELVEAVLRAVANSPIREEPSSEKLAELRRLRDAAADMASVYRGEAQYFSGASFARWEDVRAQLGV